VEAPNENRSEAFEYLYRSYFGAEILEREEIERLPALLEGVELFIDVGASLGQYTYFANQAMQNGRIIAIEADPARFAELEKNCDKWQAEGSNKITALFAACGDSNDPIQFFVTGGQISGGFFPVPERSDEYRPIEMQQVMLADFYEPGVSTFVKVDVEGAEFRVMRGAEKNIEGGHTRFLLEIAWWGDREEKTSARELLKWLEEHNLRIQKAAHRHSSNYIVSPAAPGESARADYLHVRPLLLAKATYGRIVPASVRRARERALTRFRRKHHAKINQGADASR
jgi:FkbM family methyltransferase